MVITVGDYFAFSDDFFTLLHHSVCRREGGQHFFAHSVSAGSVKDEVLCALGAEAFVRGARGVDFRDGIGFGYILSAFVDGDTAVLFSLQPLHIGEGDNEYLALHAGDVFIVRREGGQKLFLLLRQLFVSFVDRKIKVRRKGCVAPWFAYFEMIAEGIVIPREEEDDDDGQNDKRTETKTYLKVFRMENGKLKIEKLFHIYDLTIYDVRFI